MDKPVVIIGNGCAAVETCRGLRESGYAGGIEVFAAGSLPAYNPMLTSYYAAGKIDYSLMFPYGDSNRIFDSYQARVRADSPVSTLSAADRYVEANGEKHAFSQCCIASGASAVVPPFPGSRLPGVYTMRTVEDAVAVKKAMEAKPTRALVVGASMVGIKLVELFWKAGMRVTLADLADRIFPLAAHPDCSRVIEERLNDAGINQRYGAALERIETAADGLAAFFKGEEEPLSVDIIILAIGVRANLSFVDREEIEVRQGVLVDSRMQTSVPGIYAAGDCAQGMNILSGEQQIIGLWANARNQGFTAGCNMAGVQREYAGEILHNITHFMGMDFVGIGDVGVGNESRVETAPGWYKQVFYKDGTVCGANFIDYYNESGLFKNALIKRTLRAGQADRSCVGQPIKPLHEFLLEAVLACGDAG